MDSGAANDADIQVLGESMIAMRLALLLPWISMRPPLGSSGLEVMAAGSGGWCQGAVVPQYFKALQGGRGIGRGRLATKRRAERAEAKVGYR